MESKEKVNRKLIELNSREEGKPWMPGEGLHALTKFNFKQPDGSDVPEFTGNTGLPVKAFVHSITGEIKLFAAVLFKE